MPSAKRGFTTISIFLSIAGLLLVAALGWLWAYRTVDAPSVTGGVHFARNVSAHQRPTADHPLAQRPAQNPAAARRPVAAKRPAAARAAWEQGRHTPPPEILARLLKRLHREALQHFYADPRFGYSRMPLVYEKVVRKWETPYFSPGELGTSEAIPFEDDLQRIHRSSLSDFTNPKPLPEKGRIPGRTSRFPFDRNARRQKVFEAKSVDLVGMIAHPDPIVYDSTKLTQGKPAGKVATRPLDEFEASGL